MSIISARPTGEPRWLRWLLITLALLFLWLNLALPLAAVFVEGLRKGLAAYAAAITAPDALSALKLTLTVAAIAVPLNVVFGV
ncbi:MAG: sulfate/thiosulfate ABC transporter permease CysW, partial [Polymorphobacter sp.]